MARKIIYGILLGLLVSCATDKPKRSKSEPVDDFDLDEDSSAPTAGGTFVYSLSNNKMTSRKINKSKVDSIRSKIESQTKKSKGGLLIKDLVSLMSATRLSGRGGFNSVLKVAKRISIAGMKKNINYELGEDAKLELGLAAIGSKKYGMADMYLNGLTSSKNAKIKAAAYNAIGVLFLSDGRVPEAAANWKKAIKVSQGYEPASLNLGMIALIAGDDAAAKSYLGRVRSDWFIDSLKIILAKRKGDFDEADQLCKRILKKNHKPTVYNCGLHRWESHKDSKGSKALINKALKMPGGDPKWDDIAYRVLNQIK